MKQKIEIFTAGCPVCDPVVNLVKETISDNSDIIIYDLVKQCEEKTCIQKMSVYGINRVPSIVVNGKLLECCDSPITKQDLVMAGISQS
ncbi:MAG: glutaredoxin [Terrimonas sp.]|nr:glutaredoxin [Terrimonas sp.]